MKYATIGTSWITEKFISACNYSKKLDLLAVYSRNINTAKEFAEKHNAEYYYDSFDALANNKDIEAVYIASPNIFHYEQSKYFLEHGINVFCEKPATTKLEQYLELTEYAQKNNLIYLEAIMSIHTAGFSFLKSKINEMGKIRSVHFDFCQLSSKYNLYLDNKNPNIFNPYMHAGCLMDIGVYNLYLAIGLFGPPKSITSKSLFLPNGCDSSGCAILEYDDLLVNLNYSKVGQSYSSSEIIGDLGTIQISSVSQITGVIYNDKNIKSLIIDNDISRDEIMSGEILFFYKMCKTKNYSDEKYLFAKNTAITVREVCDSIRKQNLFLF